VKKARTLVAGAVLAVAMTAGFAAHATSNKPAQADLLIKFRDVSTLKSFAIMSQGAGSKVETLGDTNWVHVKMSDKQANDVSIEDIRSNPEVLSIEDSSSSRSICEAHRCIWCTTFDDAG
jgi:hypothetical protein